MRTGASALRRAGFAAMLACLSPIALPPAPAQASEIRYIVNKEAITSYDIQRRAAFLRLQNKRGNLQSMAAEEMINQAVRNAEARRLNIRVADSQVNEAYERFSRTNNMSPAQMDNILNRAGVTKAHFSDFIRSQISWSQVLSRNSRAGSQMTEQDVVRRMLEQGGSKPTAREYMLQQVIFVVPAAERRAKLGARKREAEAMRQRFRSCDSTREFAKGLIDVTVRDLGRVLEPELPPDWEKQVKATSAGAATTVRETERGVEFIGVCSTREVSDDRVAQMVFGMEQQGGDSDTDKTSEKLTKELRDKAQIVQR
ncbi:MAG TPA: peptidylprolyl isomerase [Aquamicrobium sp.]|jgi:peptidyl-prolyl cis-trans isomerase SurA|nr:peptidylprolyl isomerase [Aquamicrobium sp.]